MILDPSFGAGGYLWLAITYRGFWTEIDDNHLWWRGTSRRVLRSLSRAGFWSVLCRTHYLEPKIHIPKNTGSQANTWVMFVWPPWEDPGGGRRHLHHDQHQQVHPEHVEIKLWHRKKVVKIAPSSTTLFSGSSRGLQKGRQGRPHQDSQKLF